MNVMTNCSSFRSGYLCLPRFVGAGLHCHLQRHLQRHPRHMAALLPLVREPLAGGEPLKARVIDGGREVEQQDITVVLPRCCSSPTSPVVSSCPVCSVRSRVIRRGGLLLPLMAVRELDPADRQRKLLLGVPADMHHLLVPLARTRA